MGELTRERRAVAITGARTYVATRLIRHMEQDPRYERILALDVAPPPTPLDKTDFVEVDLTLPSATKRIAQSLAEANVDTFVHGAFLSGPSRAQSWASELQDAGTSHVLEACAEVGTPRLALLSSTLVYGPSPENPNLLTEDAPLADHSPNRFIADKVEAEQSVARFAADHPETAVAVLRMAPVLGPNANNFFTQFFSRPVAPVLMGYDPLLQFIHERDASRALQRVVDDRSVSGIYNFAAPGVLPYASVLALMGKVPAPIPHFLARPLSRALWATQLTNAPPSFLDFLRYLCVADPSKSRRELGFRPRYTIRQTILDFLGVAEDDLDIAEVYG